MTTTLNMTGMAAADAPVPMLSTKRDWKTALAAIRKLRADPNDTNQVFRIFKALNTDTAKRNYERLLGSAEGGRIAFEQHELTEVFANPDFVTSFAEGSVGAAYAEFLWETGYTAQGLVDLGRAQDPSRGAAHPYAWFGRRQGATHDIWHVLTGYQADDPLGEACLAAFTYAQTGGLGFALIASGVGLKGGSKPLRAVWEGYRMGRKAKWLPGEDYERLLAEPIDAARARLGLFDPIRYRDAKAAYAAARA